MAINNKLKESSGGLLIACAVATALALLPLPYSFYVLLRLLFFVTIVICVVLLFEQKTLNVITVALLGFAVLYNPFILVHLGSKSLWFLINLLTLHLMFKAQELLDTKEKPPED